MTVFGILVMIECVLIHVMAIGIAVMAIMYIIDSIIDHFMK